MFLLFIATITSFSSSFALNYNEVHNERNSQKVAEIFNSIKNFQPTMEPKTEISLQDGKAVSLKDYRGKLLIVYFWATWCNNCIKELEQLQKLKEEIGYRERKDIEILAVSVDFKPWDRVAATLPANKVRDLVFLVDQKKALMGDMGVKSLPTSFLIDQSGYIILRNEEKAAWDSPEMLANLLSLKEKLDAGKDDATKKENDNLNQPGIITNIEQKNKPIIIN